MLGCQESVLGAALRTPLTMLTGMLGSVTSAERNSMFEIFSAGII